MRKRDMVEINLSGVTLQRQHSGCIVQGTTEMSTVLRNVV